MISREQISKLEEEFDSALGFISLVLQEPKVTQVKTAEQILDGEIKLEDETCEYQGSDEYENGFIFSIQKAKGKRYYKINSYSSSWDGDQAYWEFNEVKPAQKTITVWNMI